MSVFTGAVHIADSSFSFCFYRNCVAVGRGNAFAAHDLDCLDLVVILGVFLCAGIGVGLICRRSVVAEALAVC